ncbi:predicted protein [Botrytis cinerea T4]|uniref:Uncharacterized protein n=1 Tax=Botryotinia fuckeliana (strain T4) TaxID=999810 RepID=G2YJI6_BOTF4|nr:predicted protein [Botrytis cinerea T4]
MPTYTATNNPSLEGWWSCCACSREIDSNTWGWYCPDCSHPCCTYCSVPPQQAWY